MQCFDATHPRCNTPIFFYIEQQSSQSQSCTAPRAFASAALIFRYTFRYTCYKIPCRFQTLPVIFEYYILFAIRNASNKLPVAYSFFVSLRWRIIRGERLILGKGVLNMLAHLFESCTTKQGSFQPIRVCIFHTNIIYFHAISRCIGSYLAFGLVASKYRIAPEHQRI